MRAQELAFAAMHCASASAFGPPGRDVGWEWRASTRCSSVSPAIDVDSLPEGARNLAVARVDRDASGYDHGGGFVAHAGGASAPSPAGALKRFRCPCPPNCDGCGRGYAFTVRALAADGKAVLAAGSRKKSPSARSVG